MPEDFEKPNLCRLDLAEYLLYKEEVVKKSRFHRGVSFSKEAFKTSLCKEIPMLECWEGEQLNVTVTNGDRRWSGGRFSSR